jgi:hypothetical protein
MACGLFLIFFSKKDWNNLLLWRYKMKRFAICLLVGATIVAAQSAADSAAMHRKSGPDQVVPEKIGIVVRDSGRTIQELQEKLRLAIEKARDVADSAKASAMEFRKQLQGKSAADSAKIINEHRAKVQERLQKAIEALDKASTKANAQIEQVRERIQSRLQQKKEELIQLQERIRAREQAREAEKNKPKN